jgi:type II secretory pathway pseudopilin PulG
MKLQCSNSNTLRGRRAFTLVEALVVSTTLVIVIGSVIMANLFGLSMATRQQIWLGATDDSAQAISTLMSDIRSAVTMAVGTYSSGTFVTNATTNQQSGSALMIYTSTNLTPSVLYYYNTTTSNLMRNYTGASSITSYSMVSANPITNDLTHPIFTEVDYTGTPLSNGTPVASVSIYLSFLKLQDPQVVIESGSVVDLYQIITTVSPRIRL